jgi:nucleoside phosphorylase
LRLIRETGIDEIAQQAGAVRVEEILEREECRYSYVPSHEPKIPIYEPVDPDEFEQNVQRIDVVVFTTTEKEEHALHEQMRPLDGKSGLLQSTMDLQTYRIGTLGRYSVAHTRCSMGSSETQASALSAAEVIRKLKPKAMIVVGISFGFDCKNHRLGDVIVAEEVFPYGPRRVNDDGSITPRGKRKDCDRRLVQAFTDWIPDWHLTRGCKAVEVHCGTVASGDVLVDNLPLRNELQNLCQDAIAGEMEATGFSAASKRWPTPFILVKSICDWADGDKDKRAQPFAAHTAASYVCHVLSMPGVLRDLGVAECLPSNRTTAGTNLDQVASTSPAVSASTDGLSLVHETASGGAFPMAAQAPPTPAREELDDPRDRTKALISQITKLVRIMELEEAIALARELAPILDGFGTSIDDETAYEAFRCLIIARTAWEQTEASKNQRPVDTTIVQQHIEAARRRFGDF